MSDTTFENGLYHYTPNQTAPLIAAALFGISALCHLFQMMQKRTWFYTAMTIGAFMMTFGYVFRYFSTKKPDNTMLYIGQSLLIILPPSLYAATIYMTYGRIVVFVNAPAASVIRPNWVTKIFVIGDVLAFFMQAGGGGTMSSASIAELGQKVILGAFQLIFFGFFLVIALIFKARMAKSTPITSNSGSGRHTWQNLLKLLLIAALLIIGRCIYRLAEFGMGSDGFVMKNEIWSYVADAGQMFLVQGMFHFIHAGDVFSRGWRKDGGGKVVGDGESYIHLTERGY